MASEELRSARHKLYASSVPDTVGTTTMRWEVAAPPQDVPTCFSPLHPSSPVCALYATTRSDLTDKDDICRGSCWSDQGDPSVHLRQTNLTGVRSETGRLPETVGQVGVKETSVDDPEVP